MALFDRKVCSETPERWLWKSGTVALKIRTGGSKVAGIFTITLILLIFSLIFLLTPTIKELLYIDYNKYNEFIYDMRQIKLFYANLRSHEIIPRQWYNPKIKSTTTY